MLPDETLCFVHDPDYPGDGYSTTWGEFMSVNSDGFDNEDFVDIAKDLLRDGKYVGGGGAAPVFVVTLTDWRQTALKVVDLIGDKGEDRRSSSADATVKGLRPAGVDWLLPDEMEMMDAAQAGVSKTRDSIADIRARVAARRAARRAAMAEEDGK